MPRFNLSQRRVINEYIPKSDLDNCDETDEKKKVLLRLINAGKDNQDRLFFNLDRKLRQELLSLDGATVIDGSGRVLGVGAIVKIDESSEDGGRLAATKQLASYGLAVKVSSDGHIQGLGLTHENHTTSIFMVILCAESRN